MPEISSNSGAGDWNIDIEYFRDMTGPAIDEINPPIFDGQGAARFAGREPDPERSIGHGN